MTLQCQDRTVQGSEKWLETSTALKQCITLINHTVSLYFLVTQVQLLQLYSAASVSRAQQRHSLGELWHTLPP